MANDVRRLNVTDDSLDVKYCIDPAIRDEQIRQAIARVPGRIRPHQGKRIDPIAVVCYGPSLNDTWEQVRDFKYLVTCSGSHRFLLDRGLEPPSGGAWFHVEVDPRAHKAKLIGTPHPAIQYLIASACHKDVFDLLEGFNVKLWHIFDNAEEGQRILPPGEWAITGGSDAGLRALTIARFLGFTDLHVFGKDGSEGPSGKHAAAHPMQPKDHQITEYGGKEYKTTTAMLVCAKQTFHELDQMPDVRATFHGEGLVQAMARDYVPNPAEAAWIAMNKPELISAEYRELNARLHRENVAYGVGGAKHADTVLKLCKSLNTQSVLDYGCGKGRLAAALPFAVWEYDPAIPGKDQSPRPADLVLCTDVLEHIEPDHLESVLSDLHRCVKLVGYFVIHTGPASKKLADGRNAHLIQRRKEWWVNRLKTYFDVPGNGVKEVGPLLHVVVCRKPGKQPKIKTRELLCAR